MPTISKHEFFNTSNVCIEAPAGCGKTQFIVDMIAEHADSRELILTHTYAGVYSLINRFKVKSISSKRFKIETIAGFCLRLVSYYPINSQVANLTPISNSDWKEIYSGANRLLAIDAIREVIKISYSGLTVDEYQDCTKSQHLVIKSLATLIPTRILGDPLQSIFEFRNEQPITWNDVLTDFPVIDQLTTPWRWINSNTRELGEWINDYAREKLIKSEELDFSNLPTQINYNSFSVSKHRRDFINFLSYYKLSKDENLVVIDCGVNKHRTISLAKSLAGHYNHLEKIENEELISFAKILDDSEPVDRKYFLYDFLKICASKLDSIFPQSIAKHKSPKITKKTKYPQILKYFLENSASSITLTNLLKLICSVKEINIFRKELLNDFYKTLFEYEYGNQPSFYHSSNFVLNRKRVIGRKFYKKSVGRTLLIKGLEFNHSIVLNYSQMSTTEKYVSLSRASNTMRIINDET